MTRVDLDRLEAWASHEDHSDLTCQDSDRMLLRLIPELRAAREVVVKARDLLDEVTEDWAEPVALRAALNAYDQEVTS